MTKNFETADTSDSASLFSSSDVSKADERFEKLIDNNSLTYQKRISFIDTLISLMIFIEYESKSKHFCQLLNIISFCDNNSLILLKNLIYSKKFIYLFNYSFNLKCLHIFLRKFKSFFSKMSF